MITSMILLGKYGIAPVIMYLFEECNPSPPQGEYIDMTIGVILGISTMAAAALGNLVSDLAGLG